MNRAQVSEHASDLAARDELNAVAPMRADVGNCARFAAKLGHQPPVPIRIQIQPILRIGAIGMEHVAEFAAGDHGLGFLHQGIVAVIEIDRVDHARVRRQFHQFFRFSGGHRQRLF